jgi:arginine decarboxylase
MSNSQEHTPLLTALYQRSQRPDAPFYAPGHKRGQGISRYLAALLGESVFSVDLPELPELDNLFAPEAVIRQAQELAAEAFGADHTWFLVNGSTCGIEAALLATCNPGEKILLPRNSHQSAIAALILSGAIPIFLPPNYDPDWDLAHSISPATVAAALEQHPDARAVMMVYPTYYGICGDIEAIAQIAHQHLIPLIVDEAHGAHFAFHPDLPTPALAAGADLAIQSTHKVLGAMTQAAMLHLRSAYITPERISQALQLVQSTSPSYLLLASLDAARQQVALHGRALMEHTLTLADTARTRLSQIVGLRVLPTQGTENLPGFKVGDRTRLTVDVSDLGLTGFTADEILYQQLGVTAELPNLRTLTFLITLGNTAADIEKLVEAFERLVNRGQGSGIRGQGLGDEQRLGSSDLVQTLNSKLEAQNLKLKTQDSKLFLLPPLSPRDAFFAATEVLPIAEVSDRISAELVCPYPPGIPILLPGEQITPEALHYLQQVIASGGIIIGCADPELQTLKVLRSTPSKICG